MGFLGNTFLGDKNFYKANFVSGSLIFLGSLPLYRLQNRRYFWINTFAASTLCLSFLLKNVSENRTLVLTNISSLMTMMSTSVNNYYYGNVYYRNSFLFTMAVFAGFCSARRMLINYKSLKLHVKSLIAPKTA